FLTPGLRFFHQGQLEGRMKRISPHLSRRPDEPANPRLEQLYARLLAVLQRPGVREGRWQLLDCTPARGGNWTWDCFVAFAWTGVHGERLVAAVNYARNQSQCYVRLPFSDLGDGRWRLESLIGDEAYDRDGKDLTSHGLYLDVPAWKASVFSLTRQH